MEIKAKIKLLIEKLNELSYDYFLVPSNDEFQSEYVPEHLNRLKFITNFSGSNGIALIGKNIALFFTDGRYILQAKAEIDDIFTIHNIANILEYLPNGKIGYDPKLHTKTNIAHYKHFNLVACKNLIDLIWQQENIKLPSKIFTYPLKYAGEDSFSKRKKIQSYLEKTQTDALIITDSANICWLLNIRAHDIAYNPILLSYLIFHKDGTLELFSNAGTVSNILSYPLDQFYKRLELLKDKKIQLDPNTASIDLTNMFSNIVLLEDPCVIAKACKNKIEISQAKRIHIADGIAVSKLLYWLEKNSANKTELEIVEKLLEFRSLHPDFIYPSFATIAAFAEHGAIIHYSPHENTNKTLAGNGLFLLDSGGQYLGGTTDITRVIPIGRPTYSQKFYFTLVLKGHIALANSIFIQGTTGAQLDVLARYYLWQHGKDYAHGTGHGVGNCLSVHEGPQRISKYSNIPLKPGMIISNEPGYYKEGEYGIRIENLMIVKQLNNGYLAMNTLTLAPIENKMILAKMLSNDEKHWLNCYHQKVYKQLSPFLDKKEKLWLKKKTSRL